MKMKNAALPVRVLMFSYITQIPTSLAPTAKPSREPTSKPILVSVPLNLSYDYGTFIFSTKSALIIHFEGN